MQAKNFTRLWDTLAIVALGLGLLARGVEHVVWGLWDRWAFTLAENSARLATHGQARVHHALEAISTGSSHPATEP